MRTRFSAGDFLQPRLPELMKDLKQSTKQRFGLDFDYPEHDGNRIVADETGVDKEVAAKLV